MKLNKFKLEDYLCEYEFKAPFLLCCSDAESWSMKEILAMANDEERILWDKLRLGYTEVKGLPALRKQIATTLYEELESDQISCFSGAEDAIFCMFFALCEPGDHAIVLTPCYQSLLEIPRLEGSSITTIELKEERGWKIYLDEVKKAIRPNTKWFIMNFPHNPTGQVITPDELQELIKLLDKHGIWLFSDEVYRLLGPKETVWSKPAACVVAGLTPFSIEQIGIIGAGRLAKICIELLSRVYPRKEFKIWSRNPERSIALASALPGIEIEVEDSCSKLVRSNKLIVTTTASRQAIVLASDAQMGTHIIALGADEKGKQELDSNIFAMAETVIVDSIKQASQFGDISYVINAEIIEISKTIELGLLLGNKQQLNSEEDGKAILVTDLTGIASQDVFIAQWVYQRLSSKALHNPVR